MKSKTNELREDIIEILAKSEGLYLEASKSYKRGRYGDTADEIIKLFDSEYAMIELKSAHKTKMNKTLDKEQRRFEKFWTNLFGGEYDNTHPQGEIGDFLLQSNKRVMEETIEKIHSWANINHITVQELLDNSFILDYLKFVDYLEELKTQNEK